MSGSPDPSQFVIFGATGDLSRRKLLPALGRAYARGELGAGHQVIGTSSDASIDDEAFRKTVREALDAAGIPGEVSAKVCAECFFFQPIRRGIDDDFKVLARRLDELRAKADMPNNRAFYLALPPSAMPGVVKNLDEAGLSKSSGWVRLVIEKPFGTDLKSARDLNAMLHRHFDESQIYRIDHYLGKETVQNLLVFRFANFIFETIWNRERIHSVEIAVAESLGVETRAAYYDKSGALRDMVQNHLTQVLTLVAMEVPTAFQADAIRYEKIKVLRSIHEVHAEDVVRGRYAAGRIDGHTVAGYLDEPGVAADSNTETFVALKLEIDNWRWQGVPFYLRTGKRLKQRMTRIAVRFRDAPVSLFKHSGVSMDTADVLCITLQPDEGFSLHFDVKAPGEPFELKRIPLSFKYKDIFKEMPEAYETLLLDVLSGDQTLFVHGDEAEESWRLFTPLLEDPPPIYAYPSGSWGPKEAEHIGIPEMDRLLT
jgi:glucose-6-phosphate 1-dehydrogenase